MTCEQEGGAGRQGGGREGSTEGGREGSTEGGREGSTEGGREGGREIEREGGGGQEKRKRGETGGKMRRVGREMENVGERWRKAHLSCKAINIKYLKGTYTANWFILCGGTTYNICHSL